MYIYSTSYNIYIYKLTTLAPTSETINAFWQMIIENKPIFVVMVTKFIENGKVRIYITYNTALSIYDLPCEKGHFCMEGHIYR